MLIQHVLTEEIFSKVFGEDDFHRQNNVAKELYALEGTFFTGDLKKRTLRGLQPYYSAISAAAAGRCSMRMPCSSTGTGSSSALAPPT